MNEIFLTLGVEAWKPLVGALLLALAEIALCAPLCLWFGWLTAHAVATGRWATAGVAVSRVRTAGAFWAYAALSVVIAGAFLAGFVRGALSLVALM